MGWKKEGQRDVEKGREEAGRKRDVEDSTGMREEIERRGGACFVEPAEKRRT